MMEFLNDRTWPHHGLSACAMKIRTSVLNRFWQKHISDENGLRGDMPPCVRRPTADGHSQRYRKPRSPLRWH